jgi:competence protein ComEA
MKLLIAVMTAAILASVSCARAGESPRQDSNNKASNNASEPAPPKPCVNLNTASEQELITLDGIGEVMAKKIIQYREQNGPFRRPQEIIIIEGFTERKYRAISDRVCV